MIRMVSNVHAVSQRLYDVCLNILLIKLYRNKSRHYFINNLSSVICFVFVSHLQAEYTIVVGTIYHNAIRCFDEISSYIIMAYYKK